MFDYELPCWWQLWLGSWKCQLRGHLKENTKKTKQRRFLPPLLFPPLFSHSPLCFSRLLSPRLPPRYAFSPSPCPRLAGCIVSSDFCVFLCFFLCSWVSRCRDAGGSPLLLHVSSLEALHTNLNAWTPVAVGPIVVCVVWLRLWAKKIITSTPSRLYVVALRGVCTLHLGRAGSA